MRSVARHEGQYSVPARSLAGVHGPPKADGPRYGLVGFLRSGWRRCSDRAYHGEEEVRGDEGSSHELESRCETRHALTVEREPIRIALLRPGRLSRQPIRWKRRFVE